MTSKLINIIKIIVITMLVGFALGLFFVVNYKPDPIDNQEKFDVIIILGHSIDDDNLPSDWLIQRLTDGLQCYNAGMADKIVVTGGMGAGDKIPVAHAMQKWLIDNNVEAENIIVESNANNTYENFLYTSVLVDNKNIDNVLIITSDFHLYRSNLIASNFFRSYKVFGKHTSLDAKKVLYYIKEPLSIIKFWITIAIDRLGKEEILLKY